MNSKRLSPGEAAFAVALAAIPAQPVAAKSTETPASAASVKQNAVEAVDRAIANKCFNVSAIQVCENWAADLFAYLMQKFGL